MNVVWLLTPTVGRCDHPLVFLCVGHTDTCAPSSRSRSASLSRASPLTSQSPSDCGCFVTLAPSTHLSHVRAPRALARCAVDPRAYPRLVTHAAGRSLRRRPTYARSPLMRSVAVLGLQLLATHHYLEGAVASVQEFLIVFIAIKPFNLRPVGWCDWPGETGVAHLQ